MNQGICSVILLLTVFTMYGNEPRSLTGSVTPKRSNAVTFTENKGQVCDQNYNPRPDVLFGGTAGRLTFHLRENGISYQLSRIDSVKRIPLDKDDARADSSRNSKTICESIYRVDLSWLGCSSDVIVQRTRAQPGYDNFYKHQCPDGVHNVRSYGEVTYSNIYDRIDVRFYSVGDELKYDFIVHPGADLKKIRIKVDGPEVRIEKDGSVSMQTPMGLILEDAPLVTQGGDTLSSRWVLNGNTLSLEVYEYNTTELLTIDPAVRVWGTYYGAYGLISSGGEHAIDVATDSQGNVFMLGMASSSSGTIIATTGAHQTSFQGESDLFLAKFDLNGVRQWGTWYGGAGPEWANSCVTDNNDNIIINGYCTEQSSVGISSPGSHQPAFGGGTFDCFIAKFNGSGVRQWGTYYGGNQTSNNGGEMYGDVCTDLTGNIFLCGRTASSNTFAIATPGAHQTNLSGHMNAMLVKFNSSGVRQWGTYFGTTNIFNSFEFGIGCATDPAGNIFLLGDASPSSVLATPGAHQTTHGGMSDAFLAKFSTNGVRLWSTFYGGPGIDEMYDVCTDAAGNAFIVGRTTSTLGIATSGAHQTNFIPGIALSYDGFLVKFNGNGVRQWGTYYGDSGHVYIKSVDVDNQSNVVISGWTYCNTPSTVLATPGSHQTYNAKLGDAFAAKFSTNGVRLWGTYYGGYSSDFGEGCATFSNSVFMCGNADTAIRFATPGCHQPNYMIEDAFLVRFSDCTPAAAPSDITPVSDLVICSALSATLAVLPTGTITWYPGPSSTQSLGTGAQFVTPPLAAGQFTYYAESANTCGPNPNRTAITITVNPLPDIAVNNGTICSGDNFTIAPSGAATYTFSNGTNVVSPSQTTSYSVTGTSSVGCTATNVAVATVSVIPLPVISSNSGTICAGGDFTIIPSGASNYTISGGSNVVSPQNTTSYSITGTSVEGCESASPAIATVSVLPGPIISVSGGAICAGESFTLSPSGATNYSFSSGNQVVNPLVTTSYSVTGASGQGCTSQTPAVVTVTVHPPPSMVINGQSSLCVGQSAILSVSGAASYTWNTGSTAPVLFVQPVVTTSYSVNGESAEGCDGAASFIVEVRASHLPAVPNATTCSGVEVILQPSNPDPQAQYTWMPGGQTGPVLSVSPGATTTYTLFASLDGCPGHTTAVVSVTEKTDPNTEFIYKGPYCSGQAGLTGPVLDPGFFSGGQFSVSPALSINETTGMLNLADATPGIYTVSYSLAAKGCTLGAARAVSLVVAPSKQLQLATRLTIAEGESVVLEASGGSSYEWSPADWLSCNSCSSPEARPPQTTTYCVSDPASQCVLPACVSVVVDDLSCSPGKLTVPNAFTPNSDGNNDFLVVDGWQRCVTSFNIIIYDRWGEKVFESSDPGFRWDGSFRGKMMTSDVLVFVLKATLGDGTDTERKGNITLIR